MMLMVICAWIPHVANQTTDLFKLQFKQLSVLACPGLISFFVQGTWGSDDAKP